MYDEIFGLQAGVFKALANPKRLEIVHLLRDQELCVSEMLAMLNLPQANLSQHLQILRENKLVKIRRKGKQIGYSLAHSGLIQASDTMREMLIDIHKGETRVVDELKLKMKDLVPLVNDPVCGMRLSPKTAAYAFKYSGSYYYFCAQGCKEKFVDKPEKYLGAS